MSQVIRNPWEDDLFKDREASSNFLTSYLLANSDVKVLNINSPWGSGKSFFIKRWHAALSERHICIHFDAWQNDFSAEPLIALIACIEEQTADSLSIGASAVGKGAVKAATALAKTATPLIVKSLFRRYIGCELDELFGDGVGEDGEDGASELVSRLIEEQKEIQENIAKFKSSVKLCLAQAAENQGKEKTAFIFIDELDRCRPTYAVELLERVKHFFDIEDCRFIIASDSAQLAHSVCAIYGEKFESDRYLRRFFDAEYRLDRGGLADFIVASTPAFDDYGIIAPHKKTRVREYSAGVVYIDLPEYPSVALFFLAFAKYFDLQARDVLRCIRQTKAVCDALKQSNYDVFWAAFLVFLHNSRIGLYAKDIDDFESDRIIEALQKLPSVYLNTNPKPKNILDIVSVYLKLMKNPEAVWESYNSEAQIPQWRDGLYNLYMRDSALLRRYINLVELAGSLT